MDTVPLATMAMLEGEQLVAVIDTSAGRLLPVRVQVITEPTTGDVQFALCNRTDADTVRYAERLAVVPATLVTITP